MNDCMILKLLGELKATNKSLNMNIKKDQLQTVQEPEKLLSPACIECSLCDSLRTMKQQ